MDIRLIIEIIRVVDLNAGRAKQVGIGRDQILKA
jgi:hypothetical protein